MKVSKSSFEIFSYMGGYYGICKIGSHGGDCIYGGDSACEDHYNLEHIEHVFNNWDGELTHCGNNKYGIDGYTIEL